MFQKTIETVRLEIRPFEIDDLPTIHRILDQTFGSGDKTDDQIALRNEDHGWNGLS